MHLYSGQVCHEETEANGNLIVADEIVPLYYYYLHVYIFYRSILPWYVGSVR